MRAERSNLREAWSATWLAMATLVASVGAACEIPIPNGVYQCSRDSDCPSGFACVEKRCRDHGSIGLGTTKVDAGRDADPGDPPPDTPTDADATDAMPPFTNPVLGSRCAHEGDRACAGVASHDRLQCKSGTWAALAACDRDKVCKPGANARAADCVSIPDPCVDKKAGDEVCDGTRVAVCSDDLTQLDVEQDCSDNAHCTIVANKPACGCDEGYEKDDSGECQNMNDCPTDACKPGGRCVDGLSSYSCVCDKGYDGTGGTTCKDIDDCAKNPCGAGTIGCVDRVADFTCTCKVGYMPSGKTVCTNIDECMGLNACTNNYPCHDSLGSYSCEGQYLATAMPDVSPDAAQHQDLTADTDTVKDNVTGLSWQRNPPAVYPGCTATDGTSTTPCTWDQAKLYCDNLVLAGYTEWRLPSKIELESLLDLVSATTTASPAAFPNTPNAGFWTASPYAQGPVDPADPRKYWYVDFGEGWSYFGSAMFDPHRVRCVR